MSFDDFNPATGQAWPIPSTGSQNYIGLDANGHTAADVACFNDPNCDQNQRLLNLLNDEINGTGSGWLPDMTPSDSSIPSWVWLGIALVGGFVFVEVAGRR